MSIIDQKATYELVNLYDRLKEAQTCAASWANQVINIIAQIKNMPLYILDASADEKKFVDDSTLLNDTYSRAVPIPPDVIGAAPIAPEE